MKLRKDISSARLAAAALFGAVLGVVVSVAADAVGLDGFVRFVVVGVVFATALLLFNRAGDRRERRRRAIDASDDAAAGDAHAGGNRAAPS